MSDVNNRFSVGGRKYIASTTGFFDVWKREIIVHEDKGVVFHPYQLMVVRNVLSLVASIVMVGVIIYMSTLHPAWLVTMVVPLVMLRASVNVLSHNKMIPWGKSYVLREPVLRGRLLTIKSKLSDDRMRILEDAESDMFTLILGALQHENNRVVMESLVAMMNLNPWNDEEEYDHHLKNIHRHYMMVVQENKGVVRDTDVDMIVSGATHFNNEKSMREEDGMGKIAQFGDEHYAWILKNDTMEMLRIVKNEKHVVYSVALYLLFAINAIAFIPTIMFLSTYKVLSVVLVILFFTMMYLLYYMTNRKGGKYVNGGVYNIDLSTPLFDGSLPTAARNNYNVINNALRHDSAIDVIEALKEMSSINPRKYADVYKQFATVIKMYSDDMDAIDNEKKAREEEARQAKELEMKVSKEMEFESQYNSKKFIANEMVKKASIITNRKL